MKAFISGATLRCKCIDSSLTDKSSLLELVSEDRRTLALNECDIEEARKVANAYNAFFKRRYWSRRWITQELTHAKQQYWFWGPCGFQKVDSVQEWLDTVDGAYVRLQGDLERYLHLSLRAPVVSELELLPDLHPTAALTYPLKERRHHFRSLTKTVTRFSSSGCTDPRDRIFALASMCEPKVTADYNLSTAQVFTNFAGLLIEERRYCWLFGNLQTNQMYELADLGLRPCGLPSWVPDLRLPFDEHPYGFSSDPISIRVAEDSSLSCEVCCIGTFGKHKKSEIKNTMSLIPTFDCTSPPQDICSRTILFNDGGHNADIEMPDHIEPGDILASFTQEWSENDFAIILRPVDKLAGTYSIVHVKLCFSGGIADQEGWELNAKAVAGRRKMKVRIV